MRFFALLLLCLCLINLENPTQAARPLSPQLRALADQVEAAWHRQNPELAWKLLQGPVRKFGQPQLARLDAELTDRDLPSSAQILADARLSIVQQNLRIRLREPTLRERFLLIEGQHQRTEPIVKEAQKRLEDFAGQKSPEGFEAFEDRFWEYHVLRNRLFSAERFRRYAAELASRVKRNALATLDESQRATIRDLQESPLEDIDQAKSALASLDLKLRLIRLDFSRRALKQEKLDREKFAAAFALRLDSSVLDKLDLEQIDSATTRREITDSRSKASTALEANRELVDKATDFFVGLHWWQRGRYGIGSEVHGLAKSESALNSPDGLVWINMPAKPKPPARASASQLEVPQGPFHRRHHLIWAWEDRDVQFQKNVKEQRSSLGERRQYTLSTFY